MEHLLELVVILTVCGTFLLIIWLLRSLLATPVPKNDNTLLHMVIAVKGDGSCLEQTMQSLMWLRNEGSIPMELIVCDCGLDENGRKLMTLAADKLDVVCCEAKNLDSLIGDITWQEKITV